MVKDDADGKKFLNSLGAYMNGSLPQADKDWMDLYMSNHPKAQDELAFERLLRKAVLDVQSPVPMVDALAKFKERLIHEQLMNPPVTKKLRKRTK